MDGRGPLQPGEPRTDGICRACLDRELEALCGIPAPPTRPPAPAIPEWPPEGCDRFIDSGDMWRLVAFGLLISAALLVLGYLTGDGR